MKSILDPSFRYTKSVHTDLRKTFARVRRELRKQQQDPATISIGLTRNILPFQVRKSVQGRVTRSGSLVLSAWVDSEICALGLTYRSFPDTDNLPVAFRHFRQLRAPGANSKNVVR